MTDWVQAEALTLARAVEQVSPEFGYHVALTGGLLYKDGPRKDADLVFYSIRQRDGDRKGLLAAMTALGVTVDGTFGWMNKSRWLGKTVDLFFPETAKTGDDGPYGAA